MKKLNIGTLITAIENGDTDAIAKFKNEIEVVNYLPLNKKVELENSFKDTLISLSDDNSYYTYSNAMSSVVFDVLVVEYYTNIVASSKDGFGITLEEYDYIVSNSIVVQEIINRVLFNTTHGAFLKSLKNGLDEECQRMNAIGAVVSRKIDKITDAVNVKDITKLANTFPKMISKMQKDGSYDRIEQTLKTIGIDGLLNDLKIKNVREKVKK